MTEIAPARDDATRRAHDLYRLTPDLLRAILEALDREDAARLEALIVPLHAADIADLLEQISGPRRDLAIEALGSDIDPDVLTHLDEPLLSDVRERLGAGEFSRLVGELDARRAVGAIGGLDDRLRGEALAAVSDEDRPVVEEGLGFPENSAGRLMRRDAVAAPAFWSVGRTPRGRRKISRGVAAPAFWSVGRTIDHLRSAPNLPDEFHAVFAVDPERKPVGAIAPSAILRAGREVRLRALIDGEPAAVRADTDREDVSYLFRQYGLSEVAVVDDDGRFLGAVAFDDMVDAISEESEEDVLRLGGVAGTDLHDTIARTAGKRFPWLLVNLATAVLASVVIGLFEDALQRIVALAVLMPIVASMGGNAGTQTMTVAVRALATKDLTRANARRTVVKEIAVGLSNGLLLAVLMGLLAWLWFRDPALGGVIALAMVANLAVAGMAGALVPLALDRLRVDPAVAAGVVLTTVTDVVGFFAFLALGAALLL